MNGSFPAFINPALTIVPSGLRRSCERSGGAKSTSRGMSLGTVRTLASGGGNEDSLGGCRLMAKAGFRVDMKGVGGNVGTVCIVGTVGIVGMMKGGDDVAVKDLHCFNVVQKEETTRIIRRRRDTISALGGIAQYLIEHLQQSQHHVAELRHGFL